MYHQRRMQQMGGDRHSESLYFTPSGTPMREFNPMGGPDPPLSAKSTSFSNDSDAYRAVYQSQNSSNHNASKTHQRVKSFSHFLPGRVSTVMEFQP